MLDESIYDLAAAQNVLETYTGITELRDEAIRLTHVILAHLHPTTSPTLPSEAWQEACIAALDGWVISKTPHLTIQKILLYTIRDTAFSYWIDQHE